MASELLKRHMGGDGKWIEVFLLTWTDSPRLFMLMVDKREVATVRDDQLSAVLVLAATMKSARST